MDKLLTTRVGLPQATRETMVTLLNQRVGLLTDLYVQTKLAHWNVRGAHFIAYHELFDRVAGHVATMQDTVAERAATLGGSAGLPVQEIARSATLPVWPLGVRHDREVLALVADRLGQAGNLVRADIDTAAEAGDADTADLFTEVSRSLDQDLWFVEAHLEE